MEEIMNDKWISIDEAAEYLGIKTVTLRSWIRNGKEGLPAQKIGKQLVYRLKKEALQAFPKVGQCIADSVTLEEWNGSAEEHAKYLAENGNWWTDTTFIIGDEK